MAGSAPMRRFGRCRIWLIALAIGALTHASGALAQQPSRELLELREAARALYQAGRYAESLSLAEQALPLVVRELGSEHEQTGIQYYALGLTAEKAGNLGAAEGYDRETVRLREGIYGAQGPGVAEA